MSNIVFPNNGISGEKIVINKFTIHDITDDYINWLNDKKLMEFSNQSFKEHRRASAINYLNSFKNSPNLFLKIITLNKLMIGTITYFYSPFHKTVDIGILIGKNSIKGKGYGTASWLTIVNWLKSLSSVKKITAGCLINNKKMINLIKKSDMQLESVKKKHELFNGDTIDVVLYSYFNESYV